MNIQKIDALELLQSLGDKTVDLILTDLSPASHLERHV